MAGRSTQILETVLSVIDRATTKIRGVESDARSLESLDPEVQIDADDNASDDIADIRDQLQRLDRDEAEALIKAEKSKAERDVRSIRKEILAVDDLDAEAELRADKDQAQKRVDQLNAELDKLDDRVVSPEIEAEETGAAGGLTAGKTFLQGFAASGVVTGIATALQAGFDVRKMRAKFQQQFGLLEDDAERLGKEAGQVYANGLGESEGDVLQAFGVVQRALVETGLIADTETKNISRGALSIAEVFGKDVDETIRAVGQLMKNGLAPNAEAALDVITEGLRGGVDQADDFYDTINEYSQHFAGFGLSAQDMTDIITAGFQAGQRDADKLADAVKEMRIRTVEDTASISAAYSDLGLDADDYRATILEGGPAARQAFREILAALKQVDDPVMQQRLAIELIGTQYEDLGPTALDALSAVTDGTVRATGATEDLADAMEDSTSEVEKLKRRVTTELNKALEEAAGKANDFIESMQADEIEATSENIDKYRESLDKFGVSAEEADRKVGELATETYGLAEDLIQQSIDAAKADRALDDWAGSLKQAKSDTGELVRSLGELKSALDLEDALWRAEDDFARAMEDIADSSESPRRAINDMKQAVIEFAEAAEDVPEEAVTEIISLIDEGSFRVAEARLKVLTARQTKIIDVYTPGQSSIPNPNGTVPGGASLQGGSSVAARAQLSTPTSNVSVPVSFAGANFYGAQMPKDTIDQIASAIERRVRLGQ
jgi:hypothetical protein